MSTAGGGFMVFWVVVLVVLFVLVGFVQAWMHNREGWWDWYYSEIDRRPNAGHWYYRDKKRRLSRLRE